MIETNPELNALMHQGERRIEPFRLIGRFYTRGRIIRPDG